ncbi:glycosyl hydrolase family 47 [Colletotrichum graminicola]|uniref:alpha-1,2-Mannosidase n=1 Tax=Colletotrichum graminicola (strain M1.001 / M2 / FGSC 10212) TaxID=645133 RepID=E3Q4F1_COLGM|nr:glycosyl hydrolase family 47 [Colletotrichum graminicola M1.001]EFQ25463.1 glycosyl hydrolase family 47 [Colletotrichum graminicola M1.001]WDK11262.1 glycosyl hydrolase family 47 [Colletotrichum graminicola]
MVARFQLRKYSPPTYRVLVLVVVFVVLSVLLLRDEPVQLDDNDDDDDSVDYPILQATKSSYDWSTHPLKHPVPLVEMARLPNGAPLDLPKIQFEFATDRPDGLVRRDLGTSRSRRHEVHKAFMKSWQSYTRHAWGYDELQPLSLRGKNRYNGWGVTLVDSLDTLWLMGLYDDFNRAVVYVSTIDWNNATESRCNVFETNIRYLGGLLSAYDLSNEQVLLDKAIELANMLYAAFDTPNRFPPYTFSFAELKAGRVLPDPYQSSAAIGSMSLEFTRLAQLTGDFKFYDAIERIRLAFDRMQEETMLPGMWPNYINVRDGFQAPDNNIFKLGGDDNSLYEYLPKMHVLLGGLDTSYEKMYRGAAKAAKAHLLYRPMTPQKDDILLLGTAIVNEKLLKIDQIPDVEQISCSAGGMFAMAGRLFDIPHDVEVGDKLARGCAWAYKSFKSGLMPEKAQVTKCDTVEGCEWDEQKWAAQSSQRAPRGFWRVDDARYNLRPEGIESLFILYRITGKEDLLDMAWDMFQAIQMATQTDDAHAVVVDVTYVKSRHDDTMESFFFAKTLKYFYLIFSDPQLISLDEWVFNTEAHPFKRPTAS